MRLDGPPNGFGRCGECQAWGTADETLPLRAVGRTVAVAPATAAQPITDVRMEAAHSVSTGINELDRVLGSGAVPSWPVRDRRVEFTGSVPKGTCAEPCERLLWRLGGAGTGRR